MGELVHSTINRGNFLESDMVGVFIISVIFSLLLLLVSFLNIRSIDEFLNNEHVGSMFRRSKKTRLAIKNTIALKFAGYFILTLLILLTILGFTVNLAIDLLFILLGVLFAIVCIFGCITAHLYRKTQSR